MFSREEAKKIRQEFWTSFGREYPRKWLLYNTKMKELQLKFSFERKLALVSLDISDEDEMIRAYYFKKLQSLKTILENEYLPEVVFDQNYLLPEGKEIARIYVKLENVSVYNKKDWPKVKEWLAEKMEALEAFFVEYRDIIEQ
ncbi:DUF4268 domain-containing protein [Salinimicrobium soli]|uniref:DUF4268 domain-containing protein n=1 Tax=Salinimicrobium soli TaxID=1254399 RepID=UPI003AAAF19D